MYASAVCAGAKGNGGVGGSIRDVGVGSTTGGFVAGASVTQPSFRFGGFGGEVDGSIANLTLLVERGGSIDKGGASTSEAAGIKWSYPAVDVGDLLEARPSDFEHNLQC
jgi:hypothetical protein